MVEKLAICVRCRKVKPVKKYLFTVVGKEIKKYLCIDCYNFYLNKERTFFKKVKLRIVNFIKGLIK